MVRYTEPELEMNFSQFNTRVGNWEQSFDDSEICSPKQNPAGPHDLYLRVTVHKNSPSSANTFVSFSFPSGIHLLLGICLSVFVVLLYLDVISSMSKCIGLS